MIQPFCGTVAFMPSPVRKLLDEAKKLSTEDRALLRAELEEMDQGSPQDEVEAAWDEEIVRRVKSIQDGNAVLIDHEEAERRIQKILKR
jgi:hypothetical protein